MMETLNRKEGVCARLRNCNNVCLALKYSIYSIVATAKLQQMAHNAQANYFASSEVDCVLFDPWTLV